jgi:hypothetical protein
VLNAEPESDYQLSQRSCRCASPRALSLGAEHHGRSGYFCCHYYLQNRSAIFRRWCAFPSVCKTPPSQATHVAECHSPDRESPVNVLYRRVRGAVLLRHFSAANRKLARKAWHCVLRRITFRPCDINFSEEMKGKLLGKIILVHPTAGAISGTLDRRLCLDIRHSECLEPGRRGAGRAESSDLRHLRSAAFGELFAERRGLLDFELCAGILGIHSRGPPAVQWVVNSADTLGDTVRQIPARFSTWKPQDYISADNTTYLKYDPAKPWALEIVDPGCPACASLFANIKTAGFENRYNLTYIIFPIPDATNWSGYKFMNSYLIATYLEAMKQVAPAHPTSNVAPDWRLLERIYTGVDAEGRPVAGAFRSDDSARIEARASAGPSFPVRILVIRMARSGSAREAGCSRRRSPRSAACEPGCR